MPTVLRLTWPVPPVPTVFHAARPPVRRHQDLQHILTKISPISCVLSHCLLPFPLAPPPYPDCIPRTNFPSPACLPPCRAVSWCLFCLLLGAWSVAWPSCLLHPLAHAPPSRLSSSQPSFSCCHLRAPFVLVASSAVFFCRCVIVIALQVAIARLGVALRSAKGEGPRAAGGYIGRQGVRAAGSLAE